MKKWQIFVAVGALCLGVAAAAPKFGRRHGPPGPPPEFEKYLPKETMDKLRAIHEDHSLTGEEQRKMIDDLLDTVDPEIMSKIPPPPGFENIPQDVKDQLKAVRDDSSLKWSQKMQKIRGIIDSLPPLQRPSGLFVGPGPMKFRGFPPMPPPGFESALPKETYNQLVQVHQNKDLSESEKKDKINELMATLPKDIVAKLPLPPGFEQLPADAREKARSILHNFSLGFDERHKALMEFTRALPEDQQRLVRPPPPFGGFGPFGPRPWGHKRFPHFPPPEFKDVLGADVFAQLEAVNAKKDLNWCDKKKEMDAILKTVPKETLMKLPLPPHLRKLPEDVQTQIKEIMSNFEIGHRDRKEQVRDLIEKLPEDVKKLVPPKPFGIFGPRGRGFPMGPPPDFKGILPTDAWDKLSAIHANKGLSRQERMKQIDEVMNSLPDEILYKLPLPPHLRALPADAQEQLHKIFADKTKTFEEKRKAEREFVKNLPEEQRKLVRPPSPPGFENLPTDVKAKIEAIHNNSDLSYHEGFEKIRELIDSLPEEVRNKLPSPPPPPFEDEE